MILLRHRQWVSLVIGIFVLTGSVSLYAGQDDINWFNEQVDVAPSSAPRADTRSRREDIDWFNDQVNVAPGSGSSVTRNDGQGDEQEGAATAYPAYNGPKKTIAVLDFVNKVKGIYGNWELGEGMAEMLNTELLKSNRFIVIERQALQQILKEQELGQTGLVRSESSARVGNLSGAQLLVKGVVTEFQQKSEGQGMKLGFEGFNLGVKTGGAHVGIDIRIIDASSGQIVASKRAVGKAKDSGLNLGFQRADQPLSIGGGGFKRTPLGVATRQAIHKAVLFIIEQSEQTVWSGKVIKVSGNRVFINRGSNSNVNPGDRFVIYSKGESLVDPDTGLDLGSEEELAGSVTIVQVKQKYSIGQIDRKIGAMQIKRGDSVRNR